MKVGRWSTLGTPTTFVVFIYRDNLVAARLYKI
jgi:hypothetical protein